MGEDKITKFLNDFNSKPWEKIGATPDEWLFDALVDFEDVVTSEVLKHVETVLKTPIMMLCQEIEKIPSSEQQTKISHMASKLLLKIQVHEAKPSSGISWQNDVQH